jgi:hypothetical protein
LCKTECNTNLPFTFLGLFIGNRSPLFEGGLEHSENYTRYKEIVSFKNVNHITPQKELTSGKCHLQQALVRVKEISKQKFSLDCPFNICAKNKNKFVVREIR